LFCECLHGVFSLCATCLWGEVLSWDASLNGCLGHGHGHNPRVQHISRTSRLSPLFSVPSRLVAWQSLDVTAQCMCSKKSVTNLVVFYLLMQHLQNVKTHKIAARLMHSTCLNGSLSSSNLH
jgi:hypothetical protein